MKLPGLLGALFGKDVAGPLNISGREVNRGLLRNGWITSAWRAVVITSRVHIIQEAAYVLRSQIGFQRPGGVGVSKSRSQIRNFAVHHAFVGHCSRRSGRNTVASNDLQRHDVQRNSESGFGFWIHQRLLDAESRSDCGVRMPLPELYGRARL